jgi:multiple sugar transport system permease protein
MGVAHPSGAAVQAEFEFQRRRPRRRWARLLPMVPGLLFLVAFSVYPLVYSIGISLFDWNLVDATSRPFVGLENYKELLSDSAFWHSTRITLLFVGVATTLELAIGLGLGLLFFRRFPGDKILRALLILPMVVAPIVVGLLWRYMLNVEFGVVNYFLDITGIGRRDFLGSPEWALPALMLVDIWQWTPFMFLVILAGLQGLPEDVLEAARVDGARARRIFFDHILPLLRYPVAVALVLRVIDSFRVYDLIFMTTRGGPIDSTETMSWRIYQVGFRTFDVSYAAAFSWLMLILVVVLTTLILRVLVRKEDLS